MTVYISLCQHERLHLPRSFEGLISVFKLSVVGSYIHFFLPHALSLLSPPLLFLFLPPGSLSLSPSVSILLICSPLLWKVTSGERPPQLHTALEWRRRHTWQAAECNPAKYLSSKEITWSLLLECTAGGPCRAEKPFTTWNSKETLK